MSRVPGWVGLGLAGLAGLASLAGLAADVRVRAQRDHFMPF